MKTYNFTLDSNPIDFSLFKDEKNVLVQIFCGQNKKVLQDIVTTILENIPHAICIGTTTDGEICNENVSTLRTVVTISIFENTQLKTSYAHDSNSFKCGIKLAVDLISPNTKLLILFSDGTHINVEEFLKGIESHAPLTPLCGGMAGDNGKFQQTYISSGHTILCEGAVGVSLNSDILKVATDYKFDWKTIGLEHTIDKVQGNRIYKIDGMKAVEFYGKYLGSNVSQTEFPLIIEKNGTSIARAVIAKHEDGSLRCGGNLHKGDKVKIGFGDAKSLLKDPMQVLRKLQHIKAETFFLYSCMARRRYMQDLIKLEIEPFAKIATTSGFFTYAEFYHHNKHNELLNQTLTVVALSESTENTPALNADISKINLDKEEDSYAKTIQSLTNLIEQSARDYDKQSKKLEKQMHLLMSHKQFLRYTVHEMNTPLSVIMSNIELHEMEFSKSPYLENIEVALKNIVSMYDDLSYLVKKDHIPYTKSVIDLADYLRSRVDFFAQVAHKAKSTLRLKVCCTHAYIDFNETKLQRIIDNNLTNAIKYTFENEDIIVSLDAKEEVYLFSIASHSRKIHKPEKVFEEYYREEKSQNGFGLGLNLVKRICDEEKVEIALQSNENLTTFTYKFKAYYP